MLKGDIGQRSVVLDLRLAGYTTGNRARSCPLIRHPSGLEKSRRGGRLPSSKISEVARRAGVSPSTVSYVLSGNRSISEATRARVEQAIRELNYAPHAGARSLRAGKTDVIALADPLYDWSSGAVDKPHILGHMPYVYGVVDAARRHGWNVILITGGGSAALEKVVGSKMVDGVVLLEVRANDERLKLVERLATPAVAMGMPLEPTAVPFVDFDFEGAGRLCVEHLVGLGHRHIGLLASPPGTFEQGLAYTHWIWHSVQSTLDKAGLPFHGLPVETSRKGAQVALDTLFEEEPAMSALIVNGEGMIDLLLQELQQRGKQVPTDLSVVVIGWSELTKHIVPPLTHVNVPALEMASAAIELLARGGPAKLLPASLVAGGTVKPNW
jgi:DNA-binding LacI/PurR family transcriptional regulator